MKHSRNVNNIFLNIEIDNYNDEYFLNIVNIVASFGYSILRNCFNGIYYNTWFIYP